MLPETPPFSNRAEAGRQLAQLLGFLAGRENLVVVALAPGAVPVAAEVAEGLDAALDVLVVRPLVVPGPSEISVGAVTSGGTRYIDLALVARMKLPPWGPRFLAEVEACEAARIEGALRDGRSGSSLGDRTVVIVDDGLSSANELKAAVTEVVFQRPSRLLLASPVLATGVAEDLRARGAETNCLYEDEVERRGAAGFWYLDPAVASLSEVRRLLEAARRRIFPDWAAMVTRSA